MMKTNSNSQPGPHKRQRKICECGQTFWTTAKFGNEKMCNPCYKRHSAEFDAYYKSQPFEKQREMFKELLVYFKALGLELPEDAKEIENEFEEEERLKAEAAAAEELPPEQQSHVDQDAIDAAFNALLADLDL